MKSIKDLSPPVQDILHAVSEEFGVTPGFAMIAGRTMPAPTIRRIVWLYLDRCLHWDRTRIAIEFGVSVSTISHRMTSLRNDGLYDRWCAWLDVWQREHAQHHPPCCLPPEGGQA